jgi:hypothetical protein
MHTLELIPPKSIFRMWSWRHMVTNTLALAPWAIKVDSKNTDPHLAYILLSALHIGCLFLSLGNTNGHLVRVMSFLQSVFPLNMVQGHNLSAHIPPLQHNSRTLLLPVLTPASVAKHAMDHLHLVTLHVMVLITCQHHSGVQRTVWYLWAVYHEWCMCTIKVCNQSRAIQCSSSNIVL